MIHALYGKLTGKRDGSMLLLCGSIEWSLLISHTTLSQLPAVGSDCRIYTYVHHREDQLLLMGFFDEQERTLFLDLIGVSGIGPKQALRMLSGIPASRIIEAIRKDDVTMLASTPGLGKKTAQKIILALKGKLVDLEDSQSVQHGGELLEALVQMGYDRQQARDALKEVLKRHDLAGLPEEHREAGIMREAIRLLAQ